MTIYVKEAMNIFAGDTGTDRSKHLTLDSLKLASLEEKTAEHHAGGSIGAIEIGGLGMNALSIQFKLKGTDPQTMSLFGINGRTSMPYTIYGVIRDKSTGRAIELKAVAWGRLTKLDPNEWKRGDLDEQDHEIKEITHYELYFDKTEKYFYDFLASTWRVDGTDMNSAEKTILRIA
ncbi:phage major tail tube protein [Methylovirgula sp. 4M-Z18]|uniref:phage major tail tube protein n=1 Tax=Methylovirgula sp. 4M-Z18 TaxID=2293567 RepID=UPI000E2F5776|nr:phage major tail tube protein [Methylovirgula sp. 4M-Z18]RFB80393.1 phage tail protein [Methylovirgula sp. 4M-Z18]